MRRTRLLGTLSLIGCMASCSHGGGASISPQQLDSQALGAFLNPDHPIGTIPSSLKGVWIWSFYQASNGTVAIGEDTGLHSVAEVALLTDAHGATVGAAYAVANDLGISGHALAQAVDSDLQKAAGSSITQSLKTLGLTSTPDGGTSLTSAPTTLLSGCAGALVQGFGSETSGILDGAQSAIDCPLNLNIIGCAAGAVAGGAVQGTSAPADSCLSSGPVDQAGIVESATMMLAGGPLDTILDGFNHEDPFQINPSPYLPTFQKRLSMFDAIDGTTDWQPDQASKWTSRMASANYLVVDTSMPCDYDSPHTYLEIERAQLTGGSHATCGGRMPNENAIDVTLNYLIRGPAASVDDADAIHDGVSSPSQWSTSTFPYLAEMNGE